MHVICKETTDLPKATGSADVKPLSRTQELPPLPWLVNHGSLPWGSAALIAPSPLTGWLGLLQLNV